VNRARVRRWDTVGDGFRADSYLMEQPGAVQAKESRENERSAVFVQNLKACYDFLCNKKKLKTFFFFLPIAFFFFSKTFFI
jgi:hypothetical protein